MSSVTPNPSPFTRRCTRTGSILIVSCAVLYLAAFLTDYEENILIFLANVFAPAALVIVVGGAIIAELFSRFRKQQVAPRRRIIGALLIISVLVPTVVGELRGHATPNDTSSPAGMELTVLDANLLGPVDVTSGFYDEVARRKPDIIALQELNPTVASTLISKVGDLYPCKQLAPQPGVNGMGVFARFPCIQRDTSHVRAGIGMPQIVDVALPDNKTVAVINVHTIPPHWLVKKSPDDTTIRQLSNAIVERELFIKEVLEESRLVRTDAVILAGDLNATTRNRVYRMVRRMGLFDSFSVGSRLHGGTWPAPYIPLPSWLVRIDFIFHCRGLVALHSETLPEGYGSDHRGIIAKLALRK